MAFANYSIMNRAKIFLKFRWGLLFSSHAHEHVCGTNTHTFPEGKVPNSSHTAFTVQLNWSLLHYKKQQGQRSSPVATPNSRKKAKENAHQCRFN